MKRRVAILFDNFGPYHLARLRAAADVCDLLAVEFGASSDDYQWEKGSLQDVRSVTINPTGPSSLMRGGDFIDSLSTSLGTFRPEVVFIPGWGSRCALLSLRWCLQNRIPAAVMSESTPWDAPRSGFSEWIKGRVLSLFSSALVGGSAHIRYLVQLGYSPDRIFTGYDAVDNDFFVKEVDRIRGTEGMRRSFLASARFVPKKNLPLLLSAYAEYRTKSSQDGLEPWDLVLLGDGPGRRQLESLACDLGLGGSLRMPGFVQYPELPRHYASASCFVHASRIEPWGLVVNEAMSAGLPVIVSRACGCAHDLVAEDVNGWTFDPLDASSLSELMARIASHPDLAAAMGRAGRSRIDGWGPARFASGVLSSAESAITRGASMPAWPERSLVSLLIRRGEPWS